jgi:hypothetical protein
MPKSTASSSKRSKRRERSTDGASSAGRSDSGFSDDGTAGPVRRLKIKPLATVGDPGKPSGSLSRDLRRVADFIQDERHLVAYELYQNAKGRWEAMLRQKREFDAAKEGTAAVPVKAKEKPKLAWNRKAKGHAVDVAFDEAEFDAAFAVVKKHNDDFSLLMVSFEKAAVRISIILSSYINGESNRIDQKRAPLFLQCRDNMDESEGWTLAQTLFGVTTYYRRESDGSLSIKLEGELKGIPLFEQVAVLREIDLHCFWAPFVTSSLTLAHLDKLDTVGWFIVGLPNFGIARDSCFRAIGCDCVAEDMSVLLVGRGIEDRLPGVPNADESTKFMVEDPQLKDLDIPAWPTRMGSGRLTMKMFEAKIKILGPDHCHTYILANLDPNLAFIPQALLEYVMKKLCGFLLNKLQTAAKKITKDPVRNVHAQRIRDESAFYRDWLLPKFESVAADKGWDMPTISAFELTEAQQVEVGKWNERRTKKLHSFSYFDSGDEDEKVEQVSTRSEPDLHHVNDLDNQNRDDASDMSSLSGTSASIWKNNPVSSYLRDVEKKTQERKDKAEQEVRRHAAARLRPRPLPLDRKERLRELKGHKQQKLHSRGLSSSTSIDPLPPVDEIPGRTDPPYWQRLLVASFAIVFLSMLLQSVKFLPSFWQFNHWMLAGILRDLVFVLYLCLCGFTHFAICDMLLIDAFEAFEIGMKSGDQVKSFYRGQVRVGLAALSGLLVTLSVSKAVLLAWTKAAVTALVSFIIGHGNGPIDADMAEHEIGASIAGDGNETMISYIPGSVVLVFSGVANILIHVYSAVYGVSLAVFSWQMILIRSTWLGGTAEKLVIGIYDVWMGILLSLVKPLLALASVDDPEDVSQLSWRDNAAATLQPWLLNTVFFLSVVLPLVNYVAKSYRHRTPDPEAAASVAATSSHSESENTNTNGETESSGRYRKASHGVSADSVSNVVSKDSSSKLRLQFRRKRKESLPDDDSMM